MSILLTIAVFGCSNTPELEEDTGPQLTDSVGDVTLNRAYLDPQEGRMLSIAIPIFEVAQQGDSGLGIGDWLFDEILEIESQYLPTVLRDTLLESNHWGAIRVLPEPDLSMDLHIYGSIVHSNGAALELDIQVVDSTGRQWFERRYSETFTELGPIESRTSAIAESNTDYLVKYKDPFQNLYNQIANDLLEYALRLDDPDILNIRRVSEIQHAADLSPEVFGDLLGKNDEGFTRVNRLLAENDPMLERIARMQLRHHIFIDTIDEYYALLNQDMQPVYDLWRYYSREQILEIESEKARSSASEEGGFLAISNNYYRYTSNKMFEQEWLELASGFTDELAPSILELNNRVYGLTGSVKDQYVQWRKILRDFYRQETGN